ncbi:feruloyl-CoA synthase [Flexibacter flexilis DSM 6793]|uniref:Feruloyl-CoA synthase n=1 Tax=Flexibacter flexilis DSM 6793 TaxID=927664 RepID=A0A1I1IXK4_9BACT|nr:AMP-binding protein [Flexibacter flexilis]SFC40984.1 feruloyl-CoA synthase [Flexibacter flexilis DSM 6793]
MNLLSVFDSNVRKFAQKDFIRYNGAGQTYQQVQAKTLRVAAFLQQNGIGQDDKVALFCYNSPSFVWFLLGAWRLGAVVVPVNHKLKARELEYILTDSDAKFLLFDAQLNSVVEELSLSIPKASTQGQVSGTIEIESHLDTVSPLNLAYTAVLSLESVGEILYTSGTTGFPKGCVMPHRSIYVAAQIAAVGVSMKKDERLLMAMPIWHASPLNNWFGGTLYVGGTVVLLREYHPLHFLQTIQNEKITLYFGAPISYSMPMNMLQNFFDFDLSSVRVWAYGAGPIGEDLSRKISAHYKHGDFFQVFGMTETGPTGIVLYPEEQLRKAGSIGKYPLPTVSIKVVDENGHEVGNGGVGEILMKADSCMSGYYKKPEATQEAFTADGWYITGDIVRIDEEGYMYVIDRKKDIIISGGENVYSKEVEDALLAHHEVIDVAVIGTEHPEWGETVTAVLVVKNPESVTDDMIKDFLKPVIAGYKIPKIYHFAEVLPRTPSGKIQKFILKKQLV